MGMSGWLVRADRANRESKAVAVEARGGRRAMREFLATPGAQLVLWIACGCLLMAAGWYLIGRFRGEARGSGRFGETMLGEFREMHAKGELSDEEYRTIKSMLAARMQSETKDAAEKI